MLAVVAVVAVVAVLAVLAYPNFATQPSFNQLWIEVTCRVSRPTFTRAISSQHSRMRRTPKPVFAARHWCLRVQEPPACTSHHGLDSTHGSKPRLRPPATGWHGQT